MILNFNLKYFIGFITLLAIETLIATYLSTGFIRHTFGDFLVVILLYCLVRSFTKLAIFPTAILVLAVSYIIEILQAFHLLKLLNLEHSTFAKLILGNTFNYTDLMAYSLGIITVIIVEFKLLTNE
ncbi:DUF2809 domain-containing protein [Mangrovimonas sp. YM274]|uniref:ribosomal maturation YjgA family protein n=1 Tax=Mangrovimonas sp. YM274 TaxID=3070660 RepID=UPI0027DB13F2|nr:DUF2809 domain-containing protein [Mangrovimonas sp. YM274]WMI68057.1 DUF2809 domain-containing protein [Mangrovimonas sp. YM274]